MQYKVLAPKNIQTQIELPTSKSISNRALILKAMAMDAEPINNLSDCDDTNVMLDALAMNHSGLIDVKAAGTSMRFLTAFLSHLPGDWIITGTERMKERPINILVDALTSLGARIEYLGKIGFPPLQIKGTAMDGGHIHLSGAVSSQFISALLMIAPSMQKGLVIHMEGNVISKPYIKLTLGMMKEFGVNTRWEGNTIYISPDIYKPTSYTVEGDWSAASYWYSIVALAEKAEVELLGLFKNSMQGDAKVAELFVDLGVETEFTDRGVILRKTDRIVKKMFHDFVNEPDLAQTFVVACCMLNVPFLFTGLQSLKIKETDRIEALKTEMKKLGYVISDRENSIMEWDGERCTPEEDPVIATYHDHRMAMAFAPATFKIDSLNVADPQVVTKAYPSFWDDLEKAGFTVEK